MFDYIFRRKIEQFFIACADISMSAKDLQETDRGIYLYVDDVLNDGATTFLVSTVDVVVILVESFTILPSTIQECSYGSALAQGSTSATTASTQSANKEEEKLVLCPCSPLLWF